MTSHNTILGELRGQGCTFLLNEEPKEPQTPPKSLGRLVQYICNMKCIMYD